MKDVNLILALPQGTCVATSLGVDGFANHRSPGSGHVFEGRSIYVDLKLEGGKPAFKFNEEGGWRDAFGDTVHAMESVQSRRTKTALSNNAFSAIPISAYKAAYLAKTGGQTCEMQPSGELFRFASHKSVEEMTSDEVADAAGLPRQVHRHPRCYLVFGPIEFVMLSNLTPEEYVWYSTHRPGKLFRQVIFTEINPNPRYLMAEQLFEAALDELARDPKKKTKTVYHGSAYDKIPFNSWIGIDGKSRGGLYIGDSERVSLWSFPKRLPSAFERATG